MRELPLWLTDQLAALERSALGETIRTTSNLYPILMSLHVLGIAMLVGGALAVDLRLLGIGRKAIPVTALTEFLLPLSRVGFVVVAMTGVAMFTAVSVSVGASAAAPWKLGLIAVAGINILVFHTGVYRSVGAWNMNVAPPLRARIAGGISGVTWILVIFAGRFLAY